MHLCAVTSVLSESLRPRGLWPTRLLCPRDSPGKSTGAVALPVSINSARQAEKLVIKIKIFKLAKGKQDILHRGDKYIRLQNPHLKQGK